MDSHLYLAAKQQSQQTHRLRALYQLAVAPAAPTVLAAHLRAGLLIVAALMLGGGLIFWVAANWQVMSLLSKFLLIEGALVLAVIVAYRCAKGRVAALFCATLVLGGLLAFVGQTYQTGADAWQLFAAWAVLSLIWIVLARSDLLWSLWVVILGAGIVLWSGRLDLGDVLFVDASAFIEGFLNIGLWLLLALVPAIVSCIPVLRLTSGVGWWSHRIAQAGALSMWSAMGIAQIFDFGEGQTPWLLLLIVLLVSVSLWASLQGRLQDFIATCFAVLAVNVLFLAGVARVLLDSDLVGLLLFGLIALACLGGSVQLLLKLQRQHHHSARRSEGEVH